MTLEANLLPATLYELFDESGERIYVGASINAPNRLASHARQKSWWPDVATAKFTHFDTRLEAVQAEARILRRSKPRHNIDGPRYASDPRVMGRVPA